MELEVGFIMMRASKLFASSSVHREMTTWGIALTEGINATSAQITALTLDHNKD